ncbi:U4/U6.U5 small nuclear ribonucleoprotein 27 kDa protein isoform X2 [Belonocnema kinseyi]|uniref:U4/U6.U5 small nuclear ribonucleoprotein 27 kDa protein isoform X2 n=1 Tax=Belonocnema kinseyi TaxID=2817044 RepID=UPI00143D940E|nr:U4/U6.U5 small nuclear ribonucleoprotein 27 kDa protein isoform X2 [Belonocnema kinseyi]
MGRSRTPSPGRRRDRSRERDRDRRRRRSRERRRRSVERDRVKSRERDRERDRERHRRSYSKSRSRERVKPKFKPAERPIITEADLQGKTPEEQDMMRLMGFCGFDSTKDGSGEGTSWMMRLEEMIERKGHIVGKGQTRTPIQGQ